MMPRRLVLIEDEDFIRDLYKRQLSLAGFNVDAFPNGTDGLSAVKKNTYDLLLLDIMLPDMSGLDILKHIKSDEALAKLSIILLTNLGQDSVIKEAFKMGADEYLIKASFTPDQMVAEIIAFFAKKAQEAQASSSNAPS